MLKSPYPYFGGKSKVMPEIWRRLGNVAHFVDPFFGSGASLLMRPKEHREPDGRWPLETVNDINGFIANAWRAIRFKPEETAVYADWPVNQNDLTARHYWLVQRHADLVRKLEGDPEYCDPKIAGWWLWGASIWIGTGFCYARGPWRVVNGRMMRVGNGITRRIPHLRDAGKGVQRRSLGKAGEQDGARLPPYFSALSERFRDVRVTCADWTAITGWAAMLAREPVGVLLDPPYALHGRTSGVYHHDGDIWQDVKAFALKIGDDPRFRVAYCGYLHEGNMPEDWPGWTPYFWETLGGYAWTSLKDTRGKANRSREVIYFSPHCLKGDDSNNLPLFGISESTERVEDLGKHDRLVAERTGADHS